MQVGINKVMLIGRVNGNAVVSSTRDGKKVATFILATAEKWKDPQTGEPRKKIVKHHVTCLGKAVDIAEKFMLGNTVAFVDGWLVYDKFTDTMGYPRYSANVFTKYIQALDQADVDRGEFSRDVDTNKTYTYTQEHEGDWNKPSWRGVVGGF